MKLTREELAEARAMYNSAVDAGLDTPPSGASRLLDFAEVMLPIHDALVAKYAAKAKERAEIATAGVVCTGSRAYFAMQEYDAARETFERLARELVERETGA